MPYVRSVLLATPLLITTMVFGQSMNSSELLNELHKLNTVGSVLFVAAHPDDENTALLTYLAQEEKLETAYLSLTRGGGGQNLIGPELKENLKLFLRNPMGLFGMLVLFVFFLMAVFAPLIMPYEPMESQSLDGSIVRLQPPSKNFLLGTTFSDAHHEALIKNLGSLPEGSGKSGCVYLSPLVETQHREDVLPMFHKIKKQSVLPAYIYLIQRL